MTQIVSFHAFRGEIGKTVIAANAAAQWAMCGLRVGLLDANLQNPGIHYPFGIQEDQIEVSLNDYLLGRASIHQLALDVTDRLKENARRSPAEMPGRARLFLLPATNHAAEIARMQREGYDIGKMNEAFHDAVEQLNLDVLILDMHPGLDEATLLSIAISDALFICFRPRAKDYQGTAVSVDVARKLGVPDIGLVVNMVPTKFDADEVRARVEKTYGADVRGVLPFSEDLMSEGYPGLFSFDYPSHAWSRGVKSLVGGR